MSETEASLSEWFVNNYIHKCAQLCPDNILSSLHEVSNGTELQKVVSAVVDCRLRQSLTVTQDNFVATQYKIIFAVCRDSLTVRSYLCLMRELVKRDKSFLVYLTAITFLHVVYKTTSYPLKDELLDVLATTCLQFNDVRHCVNARHSSVLSLSQAAKMMKVVANNSRSTVQLIEIELSKAYMYRALRCEDFDSDSIYCLGNVYLAVLHYSTGQYQTAIDHCTLVMRSRDHSRCSSRVVQGELLPKIDTTLTMY